MNLLPDNRQSDLIDRLEGALQVDPSGAWDICVDEGVFRHDSLADQALLFRALGRRAATGPFLAQSLASGMASSLRQEGLAGSLTSGTISASLAFVDGVDAPSAEVWDNVHIRAFDFPPSSVVLVISKDSSAIFASERISVVDHQVCIDERTPMAAAWIAGSPLCTGDGRWWWKGVALASAHLAGIADATLGRASEHARTRMQFGRPIGMFQAVKHRCADMAIQAEAAWCQTAWASMALDAGFSDSKFQASAAKIVAGAAAQANAVAYIQTLGAIGCTAESNAHLYLKQAVLYEHWCGSGTDHRRLLVQAAGAPRIHN